MNNTNENLIRFAANELITNGDLSVIDKVFSAEYVVHHGRKRFVGHKFITKWSKQLSFAMPDIQVTKIEILNQSKDTITWLRTLQGTHAAKLIGIKPSHQKIEWSEMVVSNFEDSQIVEEWVNSELLGCLLLMIPSSN